MGRDPIGWTVGVVTTHSVAVVVLLLVATAGVAAGIPQLDFTTADNSNATGDTTAAQKADYADEHFDRGPTFRPERPGDGPASDERRPSANGSADSPNSTADGNGTASTRGDGQQSGENRTVRTTTTRHVVYVHDADSDVLSRSSLLESLRFHERLSTMPSIEGRLDGKGGVRGVATLVGRQAADDPNATLAEQRAAVEELDRSEIAALVESSIERRPTAARLLPEGYEPNGSAVHVRRLAVEPTVNLSAPPAGQSYQGTARAIHRTAEGFGTAEYFTLGTAAREDLESAWNRNTLELVVPVSVLLILAVLAFAYRDVVDIVVGLLGVGISLVWTFGILGWLGVAAGAMIIVGPVLIVGLSVDYGLHVFMRHREQRRDGDGGPRGPMTRSLRSVALALVLVTVTTGIGFTANVTSDFQSIRNLAVGITLGVVSALVVFTTLVPAAKLVVDDALEAVGLDRRKTPLGSGRFLRPVLTSGVTLARRAAPVVVALALVAGLAGGAAWGGLERQGFQEREDRQIAQWKQDLPQPVGWDQPDFVRYSAVVEASYDTGPDREFRRPEILIEGDVTAPGTLDAVAVGQANLSARGPVATDDQRFRSPVTLLSAVAERNDRVAAVVAENDDDDDGVPDGNLTAVYDSLYAAAPDRAATVIERGDDGSYRALLLAAPVDADATFDRQGDLMTAGAAAVEADSDLTATAVGIGAVSEAEAVQTASSIFRTMVLALVAVFLVLLVVYRLAEGSATLGAVTALPIALVTALLLGSMYLLSVPLTPVTALLVSLVVGLGVDYSIHLSDRFALEFDPGEGVVPALERAVVGTGGALLGSTLTSAGAFTALLLHPSPQFRSFGTLVVLSLVLSFLVSVYVLPSLLVLWARHGRRRATAVSTRLEEVL